MTSKALKIMVSIERRIDRLLDLESRACGRDEGLEAALRQRLRLEDYIARELDALCVKGG